MYVLQNSMCVTEAYLTTHVISLSTPVIYLGFHHGLTKPILSHFQFPERLYVNTINFIVNSFMKAYSVD